MDLAFPLKQNQINIVQFLIVIETETNSITLLISVNPNSNTRNRLYLSGAQYTVGAKHFE